MPRMNPKDGKEDYKNQGGRTAWTTGTYDVVNVKAGLKTINEKGTRVLALKTRVLAVVEAGDVAAAKALVGKTLDLDRTYWWNLFDGEELNWNGKRFRNLTIACGCDEEFELDDLDQVVAMITATPFRLRVNVTEREYDGKKYPEVFVEETKHLPGEARKKFTADPGWAKIVGRADERRVPDEGPRAKRDKGGGKPATGKKDDAFAEDEESLPF